MSTLLIGLGYKARHGKDTVAQEIINCAPSLARRYSFAAPLKAFARVLGMKEKDGKVLQALGTDVMRVLRPNVWVDLLHYQIEEEQPAVAVITDMRFPNEFDYVKGQGGITVCVQRTHADGTPYVDPFRPADHPSETALAHATFDVTFRASSGSIETLRRMARNFVGGGMIYALGQQGFHVASLAVDTLIARDA
jgi:hypothetical protein